MNQDQQKVAFINITRTATHARTISITQKMLNKNLLLQQLYLPSVFQISYQKFERLPKYNNEPRTTISQDVQTRFPVQFSFAKFLSKIKGNF